MTRWCSPRTAMALSAAWFLTVFALFFYRSGLFMNLEGGLIICPSACAQFDILTDHLASHGSFPADSDGDYLWFGYRLFVLLVTGLKLLFGQHWKIAFAALEAAAMVSVMAVAAFAWGGKYRAYVFSAGLILLSFNIRFLMTSKYLLTDFFFSIIAAWSLILLSVGVVRKAGWSLLGGVACAAVSVFARPTGVFVACIALAAVVAFAMPRRQTAFVVLLLGGWAAGLALTTAVSHEAANGREFAGLSAQGLKYLAGGNAVVNAQGKTAAQDGRPTSPGTVLVTAPYLEIVHHRGTFADIAAGIAQRFPRAFKLTMPGYSAANNLVRAVYFTMLFGLAGVVAWRSRRDVPARAPLLTLLCAGVYVGLFSTLVPIEQRYLGVLDLGLVSCGAWAAAWLLGAMSARMRATRADQS